MLKLFAYLFWTIVILANLIIYHYRNSKNKHVFFKRGVYYSWLWILSILTIAPLIINFIFPVATIELQSQQLVKLNHERQLSLVKKGSVHTNYSQISFYIWSSFNFTGFISAFLSLLIWFIHSMNFNKRQYQSSFQVNNTCRLFLLQTSMFLLLITYLCPYNL